MYNGNCKNSEVAMGSAKETSGSIAEKLTANKVDVVKQICGIIDDPDTSQRIRADLLKELLSYCYPKQKALSLDVETGKAVTFKLDLGGKE